MAKLEATQAWQSVTLAANEVWQARGTVMVTADTTPPTDGEQGIYMTAGEVFDFASGATVYYRAAGQPCNIWREPRA